MTALEARGLDTPVPDSFAVWKVHPDEWDPGKPAGGGRLWPVPPTPPMVAVDQFCRCWVAADQSDRVFLVDAECSAHARSSPRLAAPAGLGRRPPRVFASHGSGSREDGTGGAASRARQPLHDLGADDRRGAG